MDVVDRLEYRFATCFFFTSRISYFRTPPRALSRPDFALRHNIQLDVNSQMTEPVARLRNTLYFTYAHGVYYKCVCKLNIACVPRKRITVSSDRTFPVPIWRGRFPIFFFPLCIVTSFDFAARTFASSENVQVPTQRRRRHSEMINIALSIFISARISFTYR